MLLLCINILSIGANMRDIMFIHVFLILRMSNPIIIITVITVVIYMCFVLSFVDIL